jgi:hypothetical protein
MGANDNQITGFLVGELEDRCGWITSLQSFLDGYARCCVRMRGCMQPMTPD